VSDSDDIFERRKQVASETDRSIDPLAKHEDTIADSAVDYIELFLDDDVRGRVKPRTFEGYERSTRQWRVFMERVGRHPACPNNRHVKAFMDSEIEGKGNQKDVVRGKLLQLGRMFQYWQNDSIFPHDTSFDPFGAVLSKHDLSKESDKELYNLSVRDIAEKIVEIQHPRDRAIVVLQSKLGLRASEVVNIQIQDLHIENASLKRAYPEMGSQPYVEDFKNVLYIPASREENKSRRSRAVPLDDEARFALLQHFQSNPIKDSWIFLSKNRREQMHRSYVSAVWRKAFQDAYPETELKKRVTSHYGRHFFTTYWASDVGLAPEHVQYMRGDKISESDGSRNSSSMDDYLHSFYDKVEEPYRQDVFKFGL